MKLNFPDTVWKIQFIIKNIKIKQYYFQINSSSNY